MAVAWQQTVTPKEATSPCVSAAFTPTAADQLLGFGVNGGGTGLAVTFSGTGTYSALTSALNDSANGNTLQVWDNASCSGGSQTMTNTGATGNPMWLFGFEYSGAASLSASQLLTNTPGVGTGAILGSSITVPTGSILLALCGNTSGGTNAITSPSGTNRGSGTVSALTYCVTEYAGAGAAIQPSFTSADGAVDEFWVAQVLLSPPAGSFPPVPESLITKAQLNALLVN